MNPLLGLSLDEHIRYKSDSEETQGHDIRKENAAYLFIITPNSPSEIEKRHYAYKTSYKCCELESWFERCENQETAKNPK